MSALPSERSVPLAPPLHRGSMAPTPWTGFWRGLLMMLQQKMRMPANQEHTTGWQAAANQRRRVLLGIIIVSALGAADYLAHNQPTSTHPLLQNIQITVFAILFGWIMAGFVTALMGLWSQWRNDPHALSLDKARQQPLTADARTAIIMPICNEPVATVFAGLYATCESLAKTEHANLFDLFILSDTLDPALQIQERAAWAKLQQQMAGQCQVYYRLRTRRTHRKAGNVADFCRRWGRNYRYMIVLDADSVMSGDTLTMLARLMEANPNAGIIQTAPRACGVQTLHARAQQFSGRVVGRLFTAGMLYWQLGESHYWGHNAIIRVAPFMQHCGLAKIPGQGGLSGEILSHDFVEAALMRRAGYSTWLTTDLEGSYEQQPSNLLEELQRDRRWCQGNLMNFRLITQPGFKPVHRAMLLTGVMAYASAPLWLLFLIVSLAVRLSPAYPMDASPLAWMGVSSSLASLWAATLGLLFLPRVLAIASIIAKGEQRSYGGGIAIIKSSILESLLSAVQAPVRMMAHTLFVVVALTGWNLQWKSPKREAETVAWQDAHSRFLPMTIATATVLAIVGMTGHDIVWSLLPTALPILFAAPLTVLTSAARWGRLLQRRDWLITPEEHNVPMVLVRAWS